LWHPVASLAVLYWALLTFVQRRRGVIGAAVGTLKDQFFVFFNSDFCASAVSGYSFHFSQTPGLETCHATEVQEHSQ
jgi:hypothetical protein